VLATDCARSASSANNSESSAPEALRCGTSLQAGEDRRTTEATMCVSKLGPQQFEGLEVSFGFFHKRHMRNTDLDAQSDLVADTQNEKLIKGDSEDTTRRYHPDQESYNNQMQRYPLIRLSNESNHRSSDARNIGANQPEEEAPVHRKRDGGPLQQFGRSGARQ
jgi:hypothetical protein